MARNHAPSAPQANMTFTAKDGRLTPHAVQMLQGIHRQVVAGFPVVPCDASGQNLITLTPTLHDEGAATYADNMTWTATAAATSTGAVTASVGSLPAVKVYIDGGATQAGAGDVVSGRLYHFSYSAALDSGNGGLVLLGEHSAASLVSAILPLVYPVGSIYISTNSTNPATSLGFGTWAAFGAGQVPVGFASGDPDFGTDEATGGEKTHRLTTAEIPSHSHSVSAMTSASGANNREVTGAAPITVTDNFSTGSAGSGGTHNNLQPFIVVRMWKRTA